jgi:hypothetical protein
VKGVPRSLAGAASPGRGASLRLLAYLALACLAGYIYAYASGRAGVPIRSDAFSYYVYLPAWALYQDPSLQAVADDCNHPLALHAAVGERASDRRSDHDRAVLRDRARVDTLDESHA